MANTELKTLAQKSPIGKIFDFADFFSPMLVKEIRQGIRSMGFTIIFIVAQVLLSIAILLILSLGEADSANALSHILFVTYIIVACGIQPLRGANAVNGEVKGNTIDLLSITQLSSWKIVYGKWVSIMSQSLLFTISLLPYLILRYFLGQMALFSELIIFFLIFIIGSGVTAISIGFSAIPSTIFRFLGIGLLVAFVQITMLSSTAMLFGYQREIYQIFDDILSEPDALITIAGFFFALLYLSWLALDLAASRIAPRSENRAFLRRILSLSFLFISAIANIVIWFNRSSPLHMDEVSTILTFSSLLLFIPNIIATTAERAYIAKNISQAMVRKRLLGIGRKFLYPGWASGTLFLIVATILLSVQCLCTFTLILDGDAFLHLDSNTDAYSMSCWFYSILGIFLLPAAIVSLLKRDTEKPITFYMLGLVSITLVSTIIMIVDNSLEGIAYFFIWLPQVNGILSNGYSLSSVVLPFFSSFIIIIVSLVILLISSMPHLKAIKKAEKTLISQD